MKKPTTLDDLRSRQWSVEGTTLTGAQVCALYDALPDERAACRAVGALTKADRVFDRAIQILKRADPRVHLLIRIELMLERAHRARFIRQITLRHPHICGAEDTLAGAGIRLR